MRPALDYIKENLWILPTNKELTVDGFIKAASEMINDARKEAIEECRDIVFTDIENLNDRQDARAKMYSLIKELK